MYVVFSVFVRGGRRGFGVFLEIIRVSWVLRVKEGGGFWVGSMGFLVFSYI